MYADDDKTNFAAALHKEKKLARKLHKDGNRGWESA